jgi:hypothetical protein
VYTTNGPFQRLWVWLRRQEAGKEDDDLSYVRGTFLHSGESSDLHFGSFASRQRYSQCRWVPNRIWIVGARARIFPHHMGDYECLNALFIRTLDFNLLTLDPLSTKSVTARLVLVSL